jgi:hypothetical protein
VLAPAVTDLDRSAQCTEEAPSMGDRQDPVRPVEHDALAVGVVQQRRDLTRGDDRAGRQLADPSQRRLTHEHGDQRPGPRTALAGRPGSARHLDEGIGATLRRRSHDAAAEVLEAELLHQPDQLVEERRTADGIEEGAQVDHAVDRRGG